MLRLLEPLGGTRARLLVHLFGFSLLQSVLLKYLEQGSGIVARNEWEYHVLAVIALSLAVFGPRLLLLFAASLWLVLCFLILLTAQYGVFYFPDAEWTLWLALPAGTLASAVAAWIRQPRDDERFRQEVEWSVTRVFRVMAVTTLGLAALHKLNSDFFNPAVSCMNLRGRLHDWWGVPAALTDWLGPAGIVAMEGGFCLLLVVFPPLGVLMVSLLLFEFGSIGAPPFAAIVATTALAWLSPRDFRALSAARRGAFGAWVVLVAGAWAFAARAFHGSYPLLPISLFHAQVLGVIVIAAVALRARLRGRFSSVGSEHADREGANPSGRALIYVLTLAALLNGITPYLGLKFEYSFAMLSNLRVDDDRWNSLIFPRWMRITAHDPFIHISKVVYRKLATGKRYDSGGILDPALYSPLMVKYAIQRALQRGVQVTFDFDYRGHSYHFAGTDDPTKLYSFIESLPAETLFQRRLDMGEPQSCAH